MNDYSILAQNPIGQIVKSGKSISLVLYSPTVLTVNLSSDQFAELCSIFAHEELTGHILYVARLMRSSDHQRRYGDLVIRMRSFEVQLHWHCSVLYLSAYQQKVQFTYDELVEFAALISDAAADQYAAV